jgi:hypothetical protein
MKNEMPYHTDNNAIIPYTYKSLPKKLMEESHKVDNKFLNNHLSEIEEAIDKKLLNKTSFVNQQVKYHKDSGILNHDNFFHADLATGTPISNDNFHHSNFVINSYTDVGCVPGDDLETFTGGGYGNRGGNQLNISSTSGTEGTVGECYDQIAIDSNNSTGNIRLGAYDDDSAPNDLYTSTGSISMTADYAFKSLTEFTLTTETTWLAYLKDQASQMKQLADAGFSVYDKTLAYGSLPDPAGTGYTTTGTETVSEKIGHS